MKKNDKSFGIRLKKIRGIKKITQQTLADMVGLNQHTIKDYEAGRRTPAFTTLNDLAGALGVPASELLNDQSPVTEPIQLPVSDTFKKLLKIPDRVFELAFRLNDLTSGAWEDVEGILEEEIEHISKTKKKHNGNGA